MKLSIRITSMLYVVSLIRFPTESEGFSVRSASRLLIKSLHIIAIRSWFFFCISEYDCGYRPFFAFSKGTALVSISRRYLRLDNVGIVNRIILEAAIFREAVFMRSMSPSADRLIPLRVLFWHWDMGIAQKD